MAPNRIKELALMILNKTTDIDEKLNLRDLPTPSFKPEASKSLTHDDISESRQAVLEATDELHALMLGPIGLLNFQSVCPPRVCDFDQRYMLTMHFSTSMRGPSLSKQSVDSDWQPHSPMARRKLRLRRFPSFQGFA